MSIIKYDVLLFHLHLIYVRMKQIYTYVFFFCMK
jgi:hypothetical protein